MGRRHPVLAVTIAARRRDQRGEPLQGGLGTARFGRRAGDSAADRPPARGRPGLAVPGRKPGGHSRATVVPGRRGRPRQSVPRRRAKSHRVTRSACHGRPRPPAARCGRTSEPLRQRGPSSPILRVLRETPTPRHSVKPSTNHRNWASLIPSIRNLQAQQPIL